MKMTEYDDEWRDLPENFATPDEYARYSVKRIKQLKAENKRLVACLNGIMHIINSSINAIIEAYED